MTTTFNSVPLPNASKISGEVGALINETVLLSGKHSIQATTGTGFGATFRCFGTWAQFEAIIALIGSPYTLITATETYYKCYISGDVKVEESDNPSWFYFDVSFRQDTT